MNTIKISLIILVLLIIPTAVGYQEKDLIDVMAKYDKNNDGIVKIMVADNVNGGIFTEYNIYVDKDEYVDQTLPPQQSQQQPTETPTTVKVPGFVAAIGILSMLLSYIVISRCVKNGK